MSESIEVQFNSRQEIDGTGAQEFSKKIGSVEFSSSPDVLTSTGVS